MSRNGSVIQPSCFTADCLSLFVAYLASAVSVLASKNVVGCVLMPIWAMRLCQQSSPVGLAAKGQPCRKYAAFLAQYFRQWKTILESSKHGVCFQSRAFRKIGSNVFNAVYQYFADASPVQLLLRFAGPPAVFRRIWAIVVNSVNRVPIRSWPHVMQKIQKPDARLKPPQANENPSTSVVTIKPACLGVTPALHSCPDRTQWMRGFFSHNRIMARNGIGSTK